MRNRIFSAAVIGAVSGLATYAAWHIYETRWMLVVTATMLLTATLSATLVYRKQWGGWKLVATLVAGWMVGGAITAWPNLVREPQQWPHYVVEWLISPVTGPKNLLTLELPLGTYEMVLAPWAFTSLVIPFTALLWCWRSPHGALGPLIIVAYPLFGIFFGSSAHEQARQLLVGGLSSVFVLAALVMRSRWSRTEALEKARAVEPQRTRLPMRAGRVWGGGLGASMLIIAILAASVATPQITAGMTRDVPRTVVDPLQEVERYASPLSTFRGSFDDDTFEEVLFNVDAPDTIERIRLATLDAYDGVSIRPGDDTYVRVPATLPAVARDTVTVNIAIEEYDGVWVPLAGELQAIDHDGAHESAFSDGFFYGKQSMTGVLVGQGTAQRGELRQAVTATDSTPVGSFQPSRSGPALPAEVVPEELTTWLKQQAVPASGQGLLESIATLRARGYVSHDLMLQTPEPLWMQALPEYTFEASRAGHSSDRIERLFRDLNEREAELDDNASDEELVAGIGDDEQFALAAYLIADQLGFEARVGLGVRLDTADSQLSACEAGECRGEHMTAWLEVRDSATGAWGVVDVTPQHEHAPSPDVVQRSEPENPTDVETQHAPTVPPPDPAPTDGDLDSPADDTGPGLWQRVWPVLKPVLGAFLLVTAAAVPLLIIVVLKWLRSRARRSVGDPRVRVLGVWDEYVDSRVDHGSPRQGTQTRREYASTVDSATAYELATHVDELAFSGQQVLPHQAQEAWDLLPESLAELQTGMNLWSRFLARISVRSLRRRT